jgi:hypothetical protein
MDFKSHADRLREENEWRSAENASASGDAEPNERLAFAEQMVGLARQAKTQRIPSQFQSPYDAAITQMLEFMVDAPKQILAARVFIASAEVRLAWLRSGPRASMYDANELQQQIAAKKEEIDATENVLEGYRDLIAKIHEWEASRGGK